MNGFALPFCRQNPLFVVAFHYHIGIITGYLAAWLRWPEQIGYFFVQRTWEPYTIILTTHATRGPDTYIASIFRNFQHTHITIDFFFSVFAWNIVEHSGKYIVFQYSNRFCCCFVFVQDYFIIYTGFIFHNQTCTHDFTHHHNKDKFFGIFRNFKLPSVGRENWRNTAICWEICHAPHNTFGILFDKDTVGYITEMRFVAFYIDKFFVPFFIFFHTFLRFFRNTACRNKISKCQFFIAFHIAVHHRHWHERYFFRFCAGNKHTIITTHRGEGTYCTRTGTVNYHQIFAVNGWRETATRPVHAQCLLACFCSNIEQWFCF